MAEQILMLALSPTMEKGTITKWNKKVGDSVAEADVLCEVETDKATMEYESQNEGTLLKILVEEGQDAAVGEPIAIVGQEGEEVEQQSEQKTEKPQDKEQTEQKQDTEKESEQEQDQQQKGAAVKVEKSEQKEKQQQEQETQTDQVRSTPLARNLAKEYGLDINQIKGTGPNGRITKDDIESAAKEKPAAPQTQKQTPAQTPASSIKATPETAPAMEDKTIQTSSKRSTIAKRLAESKFSAPHYYLTISVNAQAMIQARDKLKSALQTKVSFNALLMKFTAEAIKKHPQINSSWQKENIIQHGSIDIGLAVAQDDGLITPVVRNCAGKGIIAINNELTDLIERARKNQLKSDEYSSNTFTISSLGSYGIEEFTAIINPPASAILAVGAINKIPAFDENEKLISRQIIKLTLSCDHRVLDGAVSAAFLNTLRQIIESPVSALY